MGIEMFTAIAPIRHGHVIVDANKVDVGVRPQRIKVKVMIAIRLIAKILRPIRRIGNLDRRPQNHPHLCSQLAQGCHHRKVIPRTAHLR